MVARRDFGKASFLHLLDRAGTLQAYVKRDALGDEGFARFRQADVGDIVGVVGAPFRTKTNELTIDARQFRMLAKALRPLPEKWHGLTDVEARYRQRYLDLIANQDVRTTFRRARADRSGTCATFFTARGFIEVETPMMQAVAGGAAARPFVTHHNALDLDLYLRIAPELYLKRLLVGGFERVFELNRIFRNEGVSTRHNPEFTMLEFYQAYATYEDLMRAHRGAVRRPRRRGRSARRRLRYGEWEIDLTPPWRRVSMPELRRRRIDLPARDGPRPRPRRAAARRQSVGGPVARDYTQHYGAESAAGYLLLDLFEQLAEPELVQPTFVHEYPGRGLAAGAAQRTVDPQFVDRFELFIAGQEMANAFSELNDPDDQRAPLRSAARGSAPRATRRRTRWTRISSAPSSTACRRRRAKASASTAW